MVECMLAAKRVAATLIKVRRIPIVFTNFSEFVVISTKNEKEGIVTFGFRL